MQSWVQWKSVVLLGATLIVGLFTACTNEEAVTQVAITNHSTEQSIDATLSDGQSELAFSGIAAGTTSNFQRTAFSKLEGLELSVGSETSTLDLTEGDRNIVEVDAEGKVERVRVPLASSSVGGW